MPEGRNWLKWLTKDATLSVILDVAMFNIMKILREKGASRAADTVQTVHEKLKERPTKQARAEIFEDIRILESSNVNMDILIARLIKAQDEHTENRIVDLICTISPGTRGRRPALKWLNDISDEKFEFAMNLLDDNRLEQDVRRFLSKFGPDIERRIKAFETYIEALGKFMWRNSREFIHRAVPIASTVVNVPLENATNNMRNIANWLEAHGGK